MYIDGQTIVSAASVLVAIVTIVGAFLKIHNWYLKVQKQEDDIENIKGEQEILTYGVLACLKGLKEQGCNGPVTEAIKKIEQHLNEKAHD